MIIALLFATAWRPLAAVADEAAQARFYDRIARRHYEAGEYKQALRAFFEEQRLAPNPRIVFNIALCFERLGDEAQAYAYYVEYLAEKDDEPTRRDYAQAATARLAKTVSRVRVVTTPPGASIFVDEQAYGSYGVSPREIVVSPGRHRISVELAGHRSAADTIQVERGKLVEATLTLEAITGRLEIASSPVAAAVVRDPEGRTITEGRTPFARVLPVGVYVVELSAAGYTSSKIVARVGSDQVTREAVTLSALPQRTGEVVFTTNVPGALVEVDGEAVGFAPVVSKLAEGQHTLRITHPERTAYAGPLAVRPDQRAWLTAELQPPATTQRSPLTWVAGGLGAALLATGVVVGVVANDRHSEFVAAEAAGSDDLFELRSDGQTLNTTADALMITGAVGIVTGVVLYFITEREVADPSSASVAWESQ